MQRGQPTNLIATAPFKARDTLATRPQIYRCATCWSLIVDLSHPRRCNRDWPYHNYEGRSEPFITGYLPLEDSRNHLGSWSNWGRFDLNLLLPVPTPYMLHMLPLYYRYRRRKPS